MVAEAHSVRSACRVLDVSESTYFADRVRVPSNRSIRHAWLSDLIIQAHDASRGTYGTRRVHADLTIGMGVSVGHNAVEMLMRRAGLKGLPGNRRRRPKQHERKVALLNESTGHPADETLIVALWRSVLPSPAEERRSRRRLHLKALAIAGLVLSSYLVLVVSDVNLFVRFAAAVLLVVSLVAVGTGIMHDANHGSFSRRRWVNRMLCYTSDALGASSWLWRIQHNGLHHGNTNVAGFDADIALAPFARLAPTQRRRAWHRAQHLYIWPLYGFLALKNLLVSDFVALARKRMDSQPLPRPVTPAVVGRVAAGKLVHVAWAIVLPLAFNPWWAVVAFYLGCSWVVGFVLAMTFQLAHCVDRAEFPEPDSPRRGDGFVVHQLRTTCDIATPVPVVGSFLRWLVGGLDHQIEHHLAPRLPHTVYRHVALRFRELCRVHDVDYQLHPGVWAAIRSHARWLRRMGAPMESVRLEPSPA